MPSSSLIREHDFQPLAVLVASVALSRARRARGSDGQRLPEQVGFSPDDASREAHELIEEARRESDQLREDAREQGRQEGYRAGLLLAQVACRDQLQALQRLVAEARVDRAGLLREAESQVVELVIAIARRILERELTTDPGAVVLMVRAALSDLADASNACVRVHPDSLPLLADHWSGDIVLVADKDLQPGDCIVQTPSAAVDARIETKLEEIDVALRDASGRNTA